MKISSVERISPRLLTTAEAAAMLNVSQRTILNWISAEAIPYIELPSSGGKRKEYRIPQMALLRSLAGNYDLAAELAALDRAAEAAGASREEIVELLVGDEKTPE